MAETSTAADRPDSVRTETATGFFSKIGLFIRQVLSELRKVVWPTRQELTQYSLVVIVFILVIMGLVLGFDQLIVQGINWVFGTSKSSSGTTG